MRIPAPHPRWLVMGALLLVVLILIDRRMQRDPTAYFTARHGSLAAAESEGFEDVGDRRLENLRLTSTSGLEVEVSVLRPKDTGRKLPTLLILGGHRTGRDAVKLAAPDAEADSEVVVAAISYPYDGSSKLRGSEVVRALPGIRGALMSTPPALKLTVDYLLSDPLVDPRQIELAGVSLGAPLACIAGAVDPRVSRVWSIHGGGALTELLDHNLTPEVPSRWLRKPLARFGSWFLSPLQPEKFVGRIAPRPLVLINARHDERIPRESVDSLYSAARQPKEQIWLDGKHVGARRTATVKELTKLVLEEMTSTRRLGSRHVARSKAEGGEESRSPQLRVEVAAPEAVVGMDLVDAPAVADDGVPLVGPLEDRAF